MSEVIEQPQTEAEAAASALEGYNKARGVQPPAREEPEAQTEEVKAAEVVDEPTVLTLADELKALKARVSASSGDATEIRKLHGAVGEINRTLQAQQTTAKAAAPADDELAAALASAEEVAENFPEVAGPLVKALKASIARQAQAKPEDIDERVATAVSKAEQKSADKRFNEAVEMLREEHPDFETVRETPQYKAWLASKTPEYQRRFNTTLDPAVASSGFAEFKDSLKAVEDSLKTHQQKQTRLESAITPQGVPKQGKSSTLPDEDGLLIGYNKGPKRHIINR